MSAVTYDVSAAGVAQIRLARPQHSNSIDRTLARDLGAAVDHAAEDPAARVLLVTGEGDRFCGGGDLGAMLAEPDPAGYLDWLALEVDAVFRRLADLPKPVVAGVHGAVAGAGLALMLSCDVVVSGRGTRFLTAYGGVGLTPDCGASWLLPRAVGQQRALELFLTGRVLSADEALAWGLVGTVVDDGVVAERALAVAARLAEGPSWALGQARRMVREAWTTSRADSGADEARTIARAVVSDEAAGLMARFRRS